MKWCRYLLVPLAVMTLTTSSWAGIPFFSKHAKPNPAERVPEVADRSDLPRGAAALIEERERARGAKDWATADRLRNELAAMGITLIDTPTGPHWTFQRHH